MVASCGCVVTGIPGDGDASRPRRARCGIVRNVPAGLNGQVTRTGFQAPTLSPRRPAALPAQPSGGAGGNRGQVARCIERLRSLGARPTGSHSHRVETRASAGNLLDVYGSPPWRAGAPNCPVRVGRAGSLWQPLSVSPRCLGRLSGRLTVSHCWPAQVRLSGASQEPAASYAVTQRVP